MQTLLAVIPILVLLFTLLILKLPATKAGISSLLSAIVIALFFYGVGGLGISIAIQKGLALSLYVLLIIWSAVLLYHLADEVKAIDVINKNILLFIKDRFIQFLLLSWVFSSFLQGIAGFGVPVVIVTPILVQLGFDPILTTAAVLIGHSWSITFGSMGSSFYTLNLVTDVVTKDLSVWMGIYGVVGMLLTGLIVCFLYGGLKQVRKGLAFVLPTTIFMAIVMAIIIQMEMMSIIGLITALAGGVFMFTLYKFKSRAPKPQQLYQNALNLGDAILPYGLIVVLSLAFQLLPLTDLGIAFSFPEHVTAMGYMVRPEASFAKIKLFGHPAPIILLSAIVGMVVYWSKGVLDKSKINKIGKKTIKKCMPTTISLMSLITMAIIMMDSGMILQLAIDVADKTGSYYPIFAPFIGVLGSFITGSNTNSNVIFGNFQYTVAQTLGVNTVMMCAIQTIGGSIGCSIGPTQVLLGTSSAKLVGKESLVYKITIVSTLFIALILGILNYILI